MFSKSTKYLKHTLKKEIKKNFALTTYSATNVTYLKASQPLTHLSDHYFLQLDTFTRNQEPCYVQKRWKLGHNIIKDPKNLLEISGLFERVFQSFNENGLTNNYYIFKAKLRDCLRYLHIRDRKWRWDLLKQSIECDYNRAAPTERLKASFHSIKNFLSRSELWRPKSSQKSFNGF